VVQFFAEWQGGGVIFLQQAPKARIGSFDSNHARMIALFDPIEEEEKLEPVEAKQSPFNDEQFNHCCYTDVSLNG
jgi:hypothetical protein